MLFPICLVVFQPVLGTTETLGKDHTKLSSEESSSDSKDFMCMTHDARLKGPALLS